MAEGGPACGSARPAGRAREAYARFEAWADREGVSLSPFFDRRDRYTLEDPWAATRECLLPVVALTLHEDGEVVAAYPHAVDGDHREVDDALAALESAGPSAGGSPTERDQHQSPEA